MLITRCTNSAPHDGGDLRWIPRKMGGNRGADVHSFSERRSHRRQRFLWRSIIAAPVNSINRAGQALAYVFISVASWLAWRAGSACVPGSSPSDGQCHQWHPIEMAPTITEKKYPARRSRRVLIRASKLNV
jgi:hypothetical protein